MAESSDSMKTIGEADEGGNGVIIFHGAQFVLADDEYYKSDTSCLSAVYEQSLYTDALCDVLVTE